MGLPGSDVSGPTISVSLLQPSTLGLAGGLIGAGAAGGVLTGQQDKKN